MIGYITLKLGLINIPSHVDDDGYGGDGDDGDGDDGDGDSD